MGPRPGKLFRHPPLRRHLWRCDQTRAFTFCFDSKGRKLGSVSFSSLLAPRSWDKPDLALAAAAAESLNTTRFSAASPRQSELGGRRPRAQSAGSPVFRHGTGHRPSKSSSRPRLGNLCVADPRLRGCCVFVMSRVWRYQWCASSWGLSGLLSVAVVLNRFEKPAKITYLQTTESDRRNGFQTSWVPLGEKNLSG